MSPNLDLRFHGTSIYFTEQIIKSGGISSTADRYEGYMKSTDLKGEISASDRNSIARTIGFFSDMVSYQRCLPAGCIFALLPKNKEDATLGTDIMQAVDFRKNPEQLFGIFTTPENITQVKKWMAEAGLNADSVYTFEDFLQTVKLKSKVVDEQAKFNDSIQNFKPASSLEKDSKENIMQNSKPVAKDTPQEGYNR